MSPPDRDPAKVATKKTPTWVWVLVVFAGMVVTVGPVVAGLAGFGVAVHERRKQEAARAKVEETVRAIQAISDELAKLTTDGAPSEEIDAAVARMEAVAAGSTERGVKATMCLVRAQTPYLRAGTLARSLGEKWPGLVADHLTTPAAVAAQIAAVTAARDANTVALARADEIEPQARRCLALIGDDGAEFADAFRRMKIIERVHKAAIAVYERALDALAVLAKGGYKTTPGGELTFTTDAQASAYNATITRFEEAQREAEAAREAALAMRSPR